jgi:hypothetical protein
VERRAEGRADAAGDVRPQARYRRLSRRLRAKGDAISRLVLDGGGEEHEQDQPSGAQHGGDQSRRSALCNQSARQKRARCKPSQEDGDEEARGNIHGGHGADGGRSESEVSRGSGRWQSGNSQGHGHEKKAEKGNANVEVLEVARVGGTQDGVHVPGRLG